MQASVTWRRAEKAISQWNNVCLLSTGGWTGPRCKLINNYYCHRFFLPPDGWSLLLKRSKMDSFIMELYWRSPDTCNFNELIFTLANNGDILMSSWSSKITYVIESIMILENELLKIFLPEKVFQRCVFLVNFMEIFECYLKKISDFSGQLLTFTKYSQFKAPF